jgi:hypothetical protein
VTAGSNGPASAPADPHGDIITAWQSGRTGKTSTAAHGPRAGTTPLLATVLAVLAALTLAPLTPAAIRLTGRRRRWVRAAGDADRAHAAWREFRDDLTDFGLGARPGEPPRALADRVGAGLPEAASAAVRRLAVAQERARYADRPGTSEHLRRDGVTVRRGLASAARRGTRWRARILPASLLQRHRRLHFRRMGHG